MKERIMDNKPRHSILFVDDETQILSSLKRLMRREDFDLYTATNGEEGLRIMASRDIHLVVSDHRMPEMSGISFLSKVRAAYPETVRILLTGYTEIDSIKASINEGHIYKFILKPWNDDNLKQEIRKALERYDLIQANQVLHRMVEEKNKALEQINKNLEQTIQQRTRELELQNQALELTRVLFKGLPIAAMGIDSDGTIILINRKAKALEVNGRMLAVGKTLTDYFPEDVMVTFSSVFTFKADHVESGITVQGQDYTVSLSGLTERFSGKGFILCLCRREPAA